MSTSTSNNESSNSVLYNYISTILKGTNNYPLWQAFNDGNVPTDISTLCEPCQLELTYEMFYKNIASFPYTIDISNDNIYVKRYALPDNKEIVVTTDMRNEQIITSTLSGDVPDGFPKIRKTYITNDDITVEYI